MCVCVNSTSARTVSSKVRPQNGTDIISHRWQRGFLWCCLEGTKKQNISAYFDPQPNRHLSTGLSVPFQHQHTKCITACWTWKNAFQLSVEGARATIWSVLLTRSYDFTSAFHLLFSLFIPNMLHIFLYPNRNGDWWKIIYSRGSKLHLLSLRHLLVLYQFPHAWCNVYRYMPIWHQIDIRRIAISFVVEIKRRKQNR